MAILTPSQLTSASNAVYFDNVSGSITPTSVRSLNTNWVSSSILVSQTSSLTVLSASYAVTASFAQIAQTASSVNTLNQNVVITGSLSMTGSGITINGNINSINTVNNIVGRTMIFGGVGGVSGATPRLFISGSDGAFTSIGRNFNFINTSTLLGVLDASGQIYANTGSAAGQYIGVYDSPNFNTDVEHAIIVNTSSITFNYWDNGSAFDYIPYMTITPNLGDNPAPQFIRGLGISGSLKVTGSVQGNVVSASISSNTSSLNFTQGNFFTSLVGSNTFFNITNPKAGQTTNLLLTTSGAATASFSSNVKQVSGSSYLPTSGSGKNDILTFISWDGSSVYLANVKNLV